MSNKTTAQQRQALGTLRQIHFDMEAVSRDLEILLNQIFDQFDSIRNPDDSTRDTLAIINCFANCALSQAQKIRVSIDSAQTVILDIAVGGHHA